MRTIFLTSFFNSRKLPDTYKKYSVAVYPPEGFNYPKLSFFDIRNENGEWISPRDFTDSKQPLMAYREALMNLYLKRSLEIKDWLKNETAEQIALCCWCPYAQAAQRQLEQFGSFVCHTEVIRGLLLSLGETIQLDSDRKQMKKLWRI